MLGLVRTISNWLQKLQSIMALLTDGGYGDIMLMALSITVYDQHTVISKDVVTTVIV